MTELRLKTLSIHAVAAAMFGYAFFLALTPLTDPDLWWHLKTGEGIVEGRALPGAEDPFSYTSPKPLSDAQVRGLRSQWLGQVALYGVYRAGGFEGLSVFKALLAAVPFLLAYFFLWRRGASPALLLPALALPLFIVVLYLSSSFERPQAFSFLFALLAVWLLDGLRASEKWGWRAVSLPILMAFWANTHGGYILGVAIIAAYMIGESISILSKGLKAPLKGFKTSLKGSSVFFAASLSAIGASLLNPGGYSFLAGVFGQATGASRAGLVLREMHEYKSLWYFHETLHEIWPLYTAGFVAAAFVALVVKHIEHRRLDFSEAAVFILFSLFGLYYARGAVFALVVLPFIAIRAGGSAYMRGLKGLIPAAFFSAILLIMLIRIGVSTPWMLSPKLSGSWVEGDYPEGAVRFVEEQGLEGRVFNYFSWGGYLIWRAHPRLMVFGDGRSISEDAMTLYIEASNAAPRWKEILDLTRTDFILIPLIARENGAIAPLAVKMAEDRPEGWRLVYAKGNEALFVRNTEQNLALIKGHETDFGVLMRNAVDVADLMLLSAPGNPNLLISKAVALYHTGRLEEAVAVFLMFPENPISRSYLDRAR